MVDYLLICFGGILETLNDDSLVNIRGMFKCGHGRIQNTMDCNIRIWCNHMLLFTVFFSIFIVHFLLNLLSKACSSSCPVLDCWFVQEKAGRGGGLTAATSQEKSLLHVRTDAHSHAAESQPAPSDINPDRVYFVTG